MTIRYSRYIITTILNIYIMSKNQQHPEIYKKAYPQTLAKLIGLGPALENTAEIPMVVVMENKEVFICRHYKGNEESSIHFPNRNYILPDEFEEIDMMKQINRLIKGQKIIVELGKSTDEIRIFIWQKMDYDFLKRNRIKIESAIEIKESVEIPRLEEIYNDLINSKENQFNHELKERLDFERKGLHKTDITVHHEVEEIFNETSDAALCVSNGCKRPMLDEIELGRKRVDLED